MSGWERGGGEREKKREREGEKLQLKKKKRKGGGLVAGQTGSAGRAGARPPAAPTAAGGACGPAWPLARVRPPFGVGTEKGRGRVREGESLERKRVKERDSVFRELGESGLERDLEREVFIGGRERERRWKWV